MGEPIEITDRNFKNEILDSTIPALVDFGAEWCPPCRAIEPIIKALVDEYAGRVKIGSSDVDASRSVAGQFGIMSIPTLIFFKKGEEIDRIIGYVPKDAIREKIDALLY
ncbi:thioredoxin [Candidatus Sumerlaeota bacterium]|nr:thioredoxin [Candidatus Sumerlaeota bacterium]